MINLYKLALTTLVCLFSISSLFSQEKVDTTAMNKIKDEGLNRSPVRCLRPPPDRIAGV
jgi:hypothetical protein